MAIDFNPASCVVSVNVSDYDRSLTWYRDVLGFEVSYELPDYGWCELGTPFGFTIGLGQTEDVTPGTVVPTFGVHDIDAAIAHLRAHDVKVEDWHEIPDMVRLSTFWDPDGTSWMLAQTLDEKDDRG
jgi:catechol 2,3-dioxygenase-like lactoylglutathione lyase family enzyme